jgi:hypothetical protein
MCAGIDKSGCTLEKLAGNAEVLGQPLSSTQLSDLLQQAEHIQ